MIADRPTPVTDRTGQVYVAGGMAQRGQAVDAVVAATVTSRTEAIANLSMSTVPERRPSASERSDRRDTAGVKNDYLGCEARHLLDGVRDIDDGDSEFIAQPLDQRQDLRLPPHVQDASGSSITNRRGLAAPPEGDPLLTARQQLRTALQQMPDAECLDHRVKSDPGLAGANHRPNRILPDREMREELRILENEADAPPVLRHEDAGLAIDQHPSIQQDPAAIGPRQAGDQVDHGRFA